MYLEIRVNSPRSMQGPSVNQCEFKQLQVGSRRLAPKAVRLFFQLPKSVAGRQVRSAVVDAPSFIRAVLGNVSVCGFWQCLGIFVASGSLK